MTPAAGFAGVLPIALLAVVGTAAVVVSWAVAWIGFTHWRWYRFHRCEGRPVPPLSVAGWAVFYLRTLLSLARVYWWGGRAVFADRLRLPVGEPSGPPVLCVHGFHMTGACMWGIRRALERRGHPTAAVFLGLPYRSREVYGRSLERGLERLVATLDEGGRVDLVAHSMGGLVSRLALARRPDLAARVRRIVTLGSPHHGTAFLRTIRRGPVYEMMGRDVPFLERLPVFADSAPQAEVITVATLHDLVVYPVETAHLAGAQQITLEEVGHIGLLAERLVHDVVADVLAPAASD